MKKGFQEVILFVTITQPLYNYLDIINLGRYQPSETTFPQSIPLHPNSFIISDL